MHAITQYDHQPQTHNGVKTMLGLHFISTGKLPIKIGKIFSTLFEKRHSGDYDDFVYCDKEMLDNLYPQAELFIHTINQLLKEELSSDQRSYPARGELIDTPLQDCFGRGG